MPVQFGTLTSIRAVDIRPGETRVGTVAGAVIGGAGGSQIGSSTAANIAGTVGGAVIGGAIGGALQGTQRTRGIEFTIELDSGEAVAIVQPGNANDYRVGDRVRITGTADRARVSR
jgi:outer membrane lipoprotein SlyB